MKNKFIKLLSLISLTLITSCNTPIETTGYLGKKEESTAMVLKYTIYSEMSSPFKLSGSIQAMEKCEIKDKYYLSYTFDNIYSSSSITEYALGVFTKDNFDSSKTVSFNYDIDLEKMFPKTSETFKTYLFFHVSDYKRSDVYTYYTSEMKYSWDGDKVKISTDF